MDERSLIVSARKGDDAAFEILIERYRAKIYSICLRFLRAEQDAGDAAQDAMIKIYCSLKKYNFRASFATWVYSVARNTALDHLRRIKRSRSDSYEELAEQSLFFGEDVTFAAAERNDRARRLTELVNELPAEQRVCLILKDIDGYSCEEIAEILKLPTGTVKSCLHRARGRLREMIEKSGLLQ